MCEESLVGRGDGDCTPPAPLVKVDENPRLSQGSKKKQMLEEVLARLLHLLCQHHRGMLDFSITSVA